MARITVEDCIAHIPNRFQLVRVAMIRARQISMGAAPLVDPRDNKHVVTALREIAAGLIHLADVAGPRPGDVPARAARAAS